jgi:hypothetical protein
MWYRNFIVFVIFVVVDETISGKVSVDEYTPPSLEGVGRGLSSSLGNRSIAASYRYHSWQL